MGQYHSLINIDKKEIVDPHGLGLGAKQLEHLGFQGSLSDALYLLMMTSPQRGGGDLPITLMSGHWRGDRVLVFGDYTTQKDVPFMDLEKENPLEQYSDITPMVSEAMELAFRVRVSGEGWKDREVLEVF
jgi:hypothetical protein